MPKSALDKREASGHHKTIKNNTTCPPCSSGHHCTDLLSVGVAEKCWCGGPELTVADYSRHGLGNCNVVCNGDDTVLCGGSFAFSLYETDALEPRDPDYLGCYADDRDNRVFEFQYSTDFNTPEVS